MNADIEFLRTAPFERSLNAYATWRFTRDLITDPKWGLLTLVRPHSGAWALARSLASATGTSWPSAMSDFQLPVITKAAETIRFELEWTNVEGLSRPEGNHLWLEKRALAIILKLADLRPFNAALDLAYLHVDYSERRGATPETSGAEESPEFKGFTKWAARRARKRFKEAGEGAGKFSDDYNRERS